jgi:hypothetical protein
MHTPHLPSQLVSDLSSNGVKFGQIWMDIETNVRPHRGRSPALCSHRGHARVCHRALDLPLTEATVSRRSLSHDTRALPFHAFLQPSPGCGWADLNDTGPISAERQSANCDFLGSLLSAASAHGIVPGCYASSYEWSVTVGSDCNICAKYPLW